jgi:hypothetical protein
MDSHTVLMNVEMIPMNNEKAPKLAVKTVFSPYCFQKAIAYCSKRHIILYHSLQIKNI